MNIESKQPHTAVEIAEALMQLPEDARREMLAYGAGMEAALKLKKKQKEAEIHGQD